MKPSLLLLGLLGVASLFLGGCATLNSAQNARTLGKGNARMYGAVQVGYSDSTEFDLTGEGVVVFPELGGSYGLANRLDIGIKTNAQLDVFGTVKYQFLGSQTSFFASSLGAEFGMNSPFTWVYMGYNYQGHLTWYNSIHPNEKWSIFFNPRYAYLDYEVFSLVAFEELDDVNRNVFGYTAGFTYGTKFQVVVGVGQFYNSENLSIRQEPMISLGMNINLFQP